MTDGFGEIKIKIWNNQLETNQKLKLGINEGGLICIELNKDQYGFTYKNKGKFLCLEN
jgi:hypothetical protein